MSPDTASAEQRWATARSLADGVIDPGMPRRRRGFFLWVAGLTVLSWALGVLLVFIIPVDPSSTSRDDIDLPPQSVVGLSVQILGFLTAAMGFVWAKRTGRYITRWKHVVAPLKSSERKWVLKQIRGKVEPDPDKLPIVVAFARQIRATTLGVTPILSGAALMALGVGVYAEVEFVFLLQLGAVVLMVVGEFLMARDYRLAGRFLERHGDELDRRNH